MSLDETSKKSVNDLLNHWDLDGDDETYPFDWRIRINKCFRAKDVDGMKVEAAPLAQMKVIELINSSDEKIALQASSLILSQTGHGAVQKVDHTINFERLSSDQLTAMLRTKIGSLKQYMPELDVTSLLSEGGVVEAELEEEVVNG